MQTALGFSSLSGEDWALIIIFAVPYLLYDFLVKISLKYCQRRAETPTKRKLE